jgi:hypothetical protein
MASYKLNSSDSSMRLSSTFVTSAELLLLYIDSVACSTSLLFLEKGSEGVATRDNDGGARLTAQLRFRGPCFSDTRLSKDCDVSGGVFSFPLFQTFDLFEPTVYREHADVL